VVDLFIPCKQKGKMDSDPNAEPELDGYKSGFAAPIADFDKKKTTY